MVAALIKFTPKNRQQSHSPVRRHLSTSLWRAKARGARAGAQGGLTGQTTDAHKPTGHVAPA